METHYGVLQDWMNWDVNEPIDNNLDNCVIIKQPYGLWRDYTCTLPLMSICSTVRKGELTCFTSMHFVCACPSNFFSKLNMYNDISVN